jgi:hypothetical protein
LCVGQSFLNKNENILKIIAYLFGRCKYMLYIYNVIITQKQKDMKTLREEKGFKIEFNGSATYFITDNNGDVWDRVDTENKANNRLNKILKNAGL